MADTSVIDAVKIWLADCPLLAEIPVRKRHIDFTDSEGANYGIMPDGDTLLRKFISGGGKRQYHFTVYFNRISAEDVQRLENSEFIERLQVWCRKMSLADDLPVLAAGRKTLRVDAENGMLAELNPVTKKWGKYLIQFKMIYISDV